MPIIGNGLGPGGRGKDEVDLRRVAIYTPISSPTIAVYVARYMTVRSELTTLNGLEGKRKQKVIKNDVLVTVGGGILIRASVRLRVPTIRG